MWEVACVWRWRWKYKFLSFSCYNYEFVERCREAQHILCIKSIANWTRQFESLAIFENLELMLVET